MSGIRVLIVDDSALVRKILTAIFADDPLIEVVGTAGDPYVARQKIKELNPDVLTLDVEMPRMDGLTFLGNLMRLRPMPVLMISSLTEQGAETTLRALELGAVDFVAKPAVDVAKGLEEYGEEIRAKIRAAAQIPSTALSRHAQPRPEPAASPKPSTGSLEFRTTEQLIAIGASTGGTEAIKEVLANMPPDGPGVVVTQHIPSAFSGPFAARVNACAAVSVCEARDRQQILPGHAYIAPGDRHLLVERSGARYLCRLADSAPVNRHRPSVDVMFNSILSAAGKNAMGVLLTGMGADGAGGLKAMADAGLFTVAQDKSTSVVWGMPGEAVKRGAACAVLPLQDIAPTLETLARQAGGVGDDGATAADGR